jgi:hypothetical protein
MAASLASRLLGEGSDVAAGLLVGGALFLLAGLFFAFLAKQFRVQLTETTPPPGSNAFGWERQRAFARMMPAFRTMTYLGLGSLVTAGVIIFRRWVSG